MCITQIYQWFKKKQSVCQKKEEWITEFPVISIKEKPVPQLNNYTLFQNSANVDGIEKQLYNKDGYTSSSSSSSSAFQGNDDYWKCNNEKTTYGRFNTPSSIRLLDSVVKEWITRAIRNETFLLIDMLRYHPELVTCIDPISGFTALHWAAKHGNLELVTVFCSSNLIKIDHRSRGGYTALHLATKYDHPEMAYILVEKYKADSNIRDNYGLKPHQYAKRKTNNRIILQVLL